MTSQEIHQRFLKVKARALERLEEKERETIKKLAKNPSTTKTDKKALSLKWLGESKVVQRQVRNHGFLIIKRKIYARGRHGKLIETDTTYSYGPVDSIRSNSRYPRLR